MEIERINENTVKFYISYVDIESRGFEREEIWYNRERSEQLFWQMMDEVNYKEDFPVEGPLWIQVQALEKGLEIIVTKAQMPNDPSFETLDEVEDLIDLTISDKIKDDIESDFDEEDMEDDDDLDDNGNITMVSRFDEFENVIQLSHYFKKKYENHIETSLYYYEEKYYLYLEIHTNLYDVQEDIFSQVLEYSSDVDITPHVLQEYGKTVIKKDVFAEMRKHFAN